MLKGLPEQGQGDHLTPAEGRLGTRVWRGGQREHAKVIDQNVKSGQEGVHINHTKCSLFCGESNSTGWEHLPGSYHVLTHTKRLSTVISARYIFRFRKDNHNVFNCLSQNWPHF